MILLDTNVVSALRARRTPPDPNLVAWLGELVVEQAFLSTVTLLELERGTLLLERRDSAQGEKLRLWLEGDVLPRFAGRMLAVDEAVARTCAKLHVPALRPERDALIAATALVHGLTVATRNLRDFAGTGVQLVNPWENGRGTSAGV